MLDSIDPAMVNEGLLASGGEGLWLAVGAGPSCVVYIGEGGACGMTPESGELQWRFAAVCLAGAHARSAPVLALATPGRILLIDTREGSLLRSLERPATDTRPVLAISDDGRTLAVADAGDRVALWDVERGARTRELSGLDHVSALRFRADGRQLVGGNESGTFEVWEVDDGDEVGSLKLRFKRLFNHHDRRIDDLAIGDDDLVATGEGVVKLWDMKAGTLVREHARPSQVGGGLAFCGGGLLAAGTSSGTVTLWDTATGEVARILGTTGAHEGWVLAVFPAEDGRALFSFGADRRLKLWRLATGALERELPFPAALDAALVLAEARGDERLVQRAPGGLQLVTLAAPEGPPWRARRTASAAAARTLPGQLQQLDGRTSWMALKPGADQLAAADLEGTLSLWGLAEGQRIRNFKGGGKIVHGAWSPDGRTIAGSDEEGRLHLWDASSGRLLWTAQPAFRCARLAYHPDGQRLAAACESDGVQLWTQEGQPEKTLPCGGDARLVAFSPDGQMLATGDSKGTVELWDLESAARRAVFRGHASPLTDLAFSRDGQAVVSVDTSSVLRVWRVAGR